MPALVLREQRSLLLFLSHAPSLHHTPTKLTRANTCTAPSYNMEKSMRWTRWNKQVCLMVAAHTHFCDFSILTWKNTLHTATYTSNMLRRNCISVSPMRQCGKKNAEGDREVNGTDRVSNITEMNWNCHCSSLRLDLGSTRWWVCHVTKTAKSWNRHHLIVPVWPLMENRL